MRCDAGIVISASHNPYDDNGIKFFSHDGFKLPDRVEEEIEDVLVKDLHDTVRPSGDGIGRARRIEEARERYIEFIKSSIPSGMDFEGMKIVVDSANGSAYRVTPVVLKELGAQVISINDAPDGMNINRDCGSLHLEKLSKAVVEHGADLGIAHDGDADRTLFCDEKGEVIDGDRIMGLCATRMKESGRLHGDTLVATVMSNVGLEQYLERQGIAMIRASVGDRYVSEKMVEGGFNLGGEPSGHVIFMDDATTGDGPILALKVLCVMRETGRPLSELVAPIKLLPQLIVNVKVPARRPIDEFPEIRKAIDEGQSRVGNGRILVRPSGTEPKVRVMVEGESDDLVRSIADDIASVIHESMAKDPAGPVAAADSGT
jgi:phosphoglucosamine mutase